MPAGSQIRMRCVANAAAAAADVNTAVWVLLMVPVVSRLRYHACKIHRFMQRCTILCRGATPEHTVCCCVLLCYK